MQLHKKNSNEQTNSKSPDKSLINKADIQGEKMLHVDDCKIKKQQKQNNNKTKIINNVTKNNRKNDTGK